MPIGEKESQKTSVVTLEEGCSVKHVLLGRNGIISPRRIIDEDFPGWL